jgi:Fic family protein
LRSGRTVTTTTNDGNGRTARALFYWYMLRSGYWLFEFLTISRVINSARMNYYRAFQYVETDRNDLTYFIVYILGATLRAIEDLRERIKMVAAEQTQMKRIIGARGLNSRQRSVLAEALRSPQLIHTFESHQRTQGITLVTARNDLLQLVKRGLLVEVGGRRPREFAPAPDLERMLNEKRK